MSAFASVPPVFRRDPQKYRNKAAFRSQWPRAFHVENTTGPTCDLALIDAVQVLRQHAAKSVPNETAHHQLVAPLLRWVQHAIQLQNATAVVLCFDQHHLPAPYKTTERRRRRETRPHVDGDTWADDDEDVQLHVSRVVDALQRDRALPGDWSVAMEFHTAVLLPMVLERFVMPEIVREVAQFFPHASLTRLYVTGHRLAGNGECAEFARITAERPHITAIPTLEHALTEADHQFFFAMRRAGALLVSDTVPLSPVIVTILSTDTDMLLYGLWHLNEHDDDDDAIVTNINWQSTRGAEWVNLGTLLRDVRVTFGKDRRAVRGLLVMMMACGVDYVDGFYGISQQAALRRLVENADHRVLHDLVTMPSDGKCTVDPLHYVELMRVIYDRTEVTKFREHAHVYGAHLLHVCVLLRGILAQLGANALWYPSDWSAYAYNQHHERVYS